MAHRWCFAAVLLLGPGIFAPGPTTTGRAVDEINGMSNRPVPTTSRAPAVAAPDSVWVPDRYLGVQGGTVFVPGHWERIVSPREVYVPTLTVTRPDGQAETVPGGVRPPVEERGIAP
jgi:hypothetical protein